MKKQKGFSLIELLIVVAIILIIAAIAIPNLLRARISANESAAVGALDHIEYSTGFIQLHLWNGGFCPSSVLPGRYELCYNFAHIHQRLLDRFGSGRPSHQERLCVQSNEHQRHSGPAAITSSLHRWVRIERACATCSFADPVVRSSSAAIGATACDGTVSPLQ